MKYIRQIIFEMRHQPLMTWLSIVGTAITIFLIMSDFMISNLDTVNISPESNRTRILYGYGGEISTTSVNSSSASLGYELAQELYTGLDGVEIISFASADPEMVNISNKGGIPETHSVRCVDENYWNIYDYRFEEGKPFSKEEVESGMPITILSRRTAEKFFGKQTSYVGRTIMIDNKLFTVTGIITDVNLLLDQTAADAFISHVAAGYQKNKWETYLGNYAVILLLKEGIDANDVKHQVERRYNMFNKQHKKENLMLVYHDQPWTLEQKHTGTGTNATPNLSYSHRTRIIGYVLLLLIPAINLSSMTRSRMRQKIGGIGLRRAFGCTRGRIITDLLAENCIVTLVGGAIGLLLSFIFIVGFSNYFIGYGSWWGISVETTMAKPTFQMLFSWKTFSAVIIFCLILNLLSAGIPALRAAFINPAEAITRQNVNK